MTKTEEISQAILTKINSICTVNGWAFGDAKAVALAIDYVLGQGTYENMVSDLYDELTAEA